MFWQTKPSQASTPWDSREPLLSSLGRFDETDARSFAEAKDLRCTPPHSQRRGAASSSCSSCDYGYGEKDGSFFCRAPPVCGRAEQHLAARPSSGIGPDTKGPPTSCLMSVNTPWLIVPCQSCTSDYGCSRGSGLRVCNPLTSAA